MLKLYKHQVTPQSTWDSCHHSVDLIRPCRQCVRVSSAMVPPTVPRG